MQQHTTSCNIIQNKPEYVSVSPAPLQPSPSPPSSSARPALSQHSSASFRIFCPNLWAESLLQCSVKQWVWVLVYSVEYKSYSMFIEPMNSGSFGFFRHTMPWYKNCDEKKWINWGPTWMGEHRGESLNYNDLWIFIRLKANPGFSQHHYSANQLKQISFSSKICVE